MRRFGLAVALIAVVAAVTSGSALAHVTVKQVLLEKDEAPEVTLTAPNEEEATVTGVTVTAPAGFTFLSGEVNGGWKLSVTDNVISWSGGSLPPKSYTTFSFRMIGEGNATTVELQPTYTLAGGKTFDEEPVPVNLANEVGGGGSSRSVSDDLVYVVAALAGAAFLGAVAAFFLALRVWLEMPWKGETAG